MKSHLESHDEPETVDDAGYKGTAEAKAGEHDLGERGRLCGPDGVPVEASDGGEKAEEAAEVIVFPLPSETEGLSAKEWAARIWARSSQKCENCGATQRLRLLMVVPVEAGGQYVLRNGIVLCRTCEVAKDRASRSKPTDQRPINFWLSRGLYDRLRANLGAEFRSMAALVRYLMGLYVDGHLSGAYEDVLQYQDTESDMKVNVWVDSEAYRKFKAACDHNGATVTAVLRGLIKMYDFEMGRIHKRGEV